MACSISSDALVSVCTYKGGMIKYVVVLCQYVGAGGTACGRHGDVGGGLHGELPLVEAHGTTAAGCPRACLELEGQEDVLEELVL